MEKEFDVYYWNNLKGKLKENYPVLTNSDLVWRYVTEEDFLRTIAFKLGKTKRQLQEIIENF